jgi:hypothetical protein
MPLLPEERTDEERRRADREYRSWASGAVSPVATAVLAAHAPAALAALEAERRFRRGDPPDVTKLKLVMRHAHAFVSGSAAAQVVSLSWLRAVCGRRVCQVVCCTRGFGMLGLILSWKRTAAGHIVHALLGSCARA